MLQDVGQFSSVKFCIGGHRGQACVPNGEHQLDVVGTILRGDGDTFAWLKRETVAQ